MDKVTRHPLSIQKDALTRALLVNGFDLHDFGTKPEIEISDWAITLCTQPKQLKCKPIMLEDGKFALRSELLASHLAEFAGPLPIKAFSAAQVFDGNDASHPQRQRIEGVLADGSAMELRHIQRLWASIAKEAFGIGAKVEATKDPDGSFVIEAIVGDRRFLLAHMAKANAVARALLAPLPPETEAWIFSIDVDQVCMDANGISSRDELYSPLMERLTAYESSQAILGSSYHVAAIEALQELGFTEFIGQKVYEEDCYKKMNMFQGEWDKNNRGVKIDEPLGTFTGLPTVLTPALEEALAVNYKAGVESCRLFEFGHIALPKDGKEPMQKFALSFGAYGPELDAAGFKKIVDDFFNNFGIKNHFFIPIFGKAIAYHPTNAYIVMDQNMGYLESNFGGIAPKALENHGIGVPAFMAQFEFDNALLPKAMEEFDTIPGELK